MFWAFILKSELRGPLRQINNLRLRDIIWKDSEKASDVAYQDVLNKSDSTWGVKGLIVIWSNLVITSKVRPHMSIISWFPLRLRWFARVDSFIVIEFSMCAKNRHNMKLKIRNLWTIKGRVCWHSSQTSGSKISCQNNKMLL